MKIDTTMKHFSLSSIMSAMDKQKAPNYKLLKNIDLDIGLKGDCLEIFKNGIKYELNFVKGMLDYSSFGNTIKGYQFRDKSFILKKPDLIIDTYKREADKLTYLLERKAIITYPKSDEFVAPIERASAPDKVIDIYTPPESDKGGLILDRKKSFYCNESSIVTEEAGIPSTTTV